MCTSAGEPVCRYGTARVRTRVLWLVKGLGPGGAERLLLEHARVGDREHVAYEVAYLLPWKNHLVGALEGAGVPAHCLGVRSVMDPRWGGRLRRLVRQRRYDVVHMHSPAVAAVARPILRVDGARPALLYTEHNQWQSHHPVTRLANRSTMGLDDATIAVSEDVRASMRRSGKGAITVLHGVDVTAVRAHASGRDAMRADLGVRRDELLAVTVANLRANKGYETLLAAARLVIDASPSVQFVAAGQGPLEARLRASVRDLGLDERFRLLGYVPDAARLVAAADVFVLASNHEGLPLAVMEALALGVPVVATNVGGIPDLVADGVSGMLVPPGDPGALAAAVLQLTDDQARARLARGARARGGTLDAAAAVRQLDELYQQLAMNRARRTP
jgi:glycosyltransferase involved in cell wall biosynthesis